MGFDFVGFCGFLKFSFFSFEFVYFIGFWRNRELVFFLVNRRGLIVVIVSVVVNII